MFKTIADTVGDVLVAQAAQYARATGYTPEELTRSLPKNVTVLHIEQAEQVEQVDAAKAA